MTTETRPEMEKPPKRFTGGTFIRMDVEEAIEGVLVDVEYRPEEKKEKGKKPVIEQVPYYTIKLGSAAKLNVRVDEAEDFPAGALVKVKGKGALHADMKGFLAKEEGADAKTYVKMDEEGTLGFKSLYGYFFAIKRLENEEGRGKYKGTKFTRWEITKSVKRVEEVEA